MYRTIIRSLNSHICVSVSTVSRPGSLLLLETVPSCKDGKINIYSRCSDAHNTLLSRPRLQAPDVTSSGQQLDSIECTGSSKHCTVGSTMHYLHIQVNI